MSERSERKGIHIFFVGMVQGVGFRFVARDLAFRYKIKGWVKNLPDGRVEAEIQGDSKDLNNFLKKLREEFKNYITEQQAEELSAVEKYNDFQIRF